MSQWNEQFTQHPIHKTIKEVRDCLDADAKEPSEGLIIERRRLLKVLETIEIALSGLDPELAPLPILNTINDFFRNTNFWNEVHTYESNPVESHLRNLNEQINGQLPSVYQLASLQKSRKVLRITSAAENSFDTFVKAIDDKRKAFESELAELENRIGSVTTSEEELKRALKELISYQENKSAEWEADFNVEQSERSEKFTESQIAKSRDFEDWFEKFKQGSSSKAKEIVNEHTKALAQYSKDFDAEISKIKEDANQRHSEILELHGLAAGDAVVAGYVNNAEIEKTQADRWRRVALFFIIATAAWLGYAYKSNIGNSLEAGEILARMASIVPLTAVFLYGAVYASNQSRIHRNNEKQTRWFALEVKAIDPFLASLDPDQQKQLKEKLTDRIFGQNSTSEISSATNVDPNLLKVILDAMKDIAKPK